MEKEEITKISFHNTEKKSGAGFVAHLPRTARIYLILLAALLAVSFLSLFAVDYQIFVNDLIKRGMQGNEAALYFQRIRELIRSDLGVLLPGVFPINASERALAITSIARVPSVLMIGAALAACGCAFQYVFKNPMATPDLLGANAGGGLAGALYIRYLSPVYNTLPASTTLFGCTVPLSFLSFLEAPFAKKYAETLIVTVFSVLTVLFVLKIGGTFQRGARTLTAAVLAGMIISKFSQSVVDAIVYNLQLDFFDDPRVYAISKYRLPYLFNAGGLGWGFSAVLIACMAALLLLRWNLHALSFGDEEAGTMGVNVRVTRICVFAVTTVVTILIMLKIGQIGWIGLIAPHVARLLTGNSYKHNMPVAMIFGALLLLVGSDFELFTSVPVGAFTAILGAPLFVYFLIVSRRGHKQEWI